MAKWDEVIILISEAQPTEYDDDGFEVLGQETAREVFCDLLPIWETEFYKANQAGHELQGKVKLRQADYQGEKLVQLQGERYKVLRTYPTENGEFIEVTLSDLSQRTGRRPATP